MAFFILQQEPRRAEALAASVRAVKERIGYCGRCHNIAEGDRCTICLSGRRDETLICVVETPLDLIAVERTGEYRGLYHVLHGVISPIDGVGPEDIRIPHLLQRVKGEEVQEVIIATDADIEGEATAVYLHHALQPLGVQVSRPAHGLPVGGDLEYADELTLARALSGRRAF